VADTIAIDPILRGQDRQRPLRGWGEDLHIGARPIRVKADGEEETMLDGPVIKDNARRHTSAWANTLRGRDHHAKE